MPRISVLFLAAGSKDDFKLSGRFRVFNYVPFLRANDIRTRVIVWNAPADTLGESIRRIRRHRLLRLETPGKLLRLLKLLALAPLYDVVVIQRTRLPRRALIILRTLAKHLVYDFDDALFVPCPYLGVAEWSADNAETIRNRFTGMLPFYSHVIAGNEYLAAFVREQGSSVSVIPTPVDTASYTIRRERPRATVPVIGWVGAGEQHLPHLRLLLQPLVRLKARHPFVFRIIGVMRSAAFRDTFEPHLPGMVDYVDAVPQERLIEAIQDFDVGVMPLIDDPWSRGKCGYKALLTMACGIPTIASPVGVNRDIVTDGENGFLAENDDAWYRALALVLDDPDRARSIGLRGRVAVEQRYSQAVCEQRLVDVLCRVAAGDRV